LRWPNERALLSAALAARFLSLEPARSRGALRSLEASRPWAEVLRALVDLVARVLSNRRLQAESLPLTGASRRSFAGRMVRRRRAAAWCAIRDDRFVGARPTAGAPGGRLPDGRIRRGSHLAASPPALAGRRRAPAARCRPLAGRRHGGRVRGASARASATSRG